MTRRGLVLGAGGALGASWSIGALTALQEFTGWDARGADTLVGTSAGSIAAAFLASGVSVDTMRNHQLGRPDPEDTRIDYDYSSDRPLPPLPRLRLGSRSLLVHTARHPRQVTPMAAFTALLLEGRGSLDRIGSIVNQVAVPGMWPARPETWVIAMDYDTGRRVPFGRGDSPETDLASAVMASCSIPGWYAPVTIEGRRYVDGGACSPTSLDLLAGRGLDVVYVVSPMTSFELDRPPRAAARVERYLRRIVTRRLAREAEKVRASGTEVVLISPGPEDLEAFGANLMDPRRRTHVLETALRTTAAALARTAGDDDTDHSVAG
jgi:NTE family protein